MDIKKFYPSITHEMLQRKDKTVERNNLFSEGSSYWKLSTTILCKFISDHWVKEELKCKYYFRYADDIVMTRII